MKFTESETVELKEIFINDITKEIVAFANCNGGTLYIGIADDGTIAGIPHPDDTMLQVTNIVRDTIKPDITMFLHYEIETIEDKQIIKVEAQRGTRRPYYLAKKGLRPEGVYVRQGTSSVPASEDAIRQMIKETDGDIFEQARSFQQDLTFNIAEQEFTKRNLEFGTAQMKTLGLINNETMFTNLALLLSDQCPHTIKTAAFTDNTLNHFQDRREFTGSLLQQLSEAYAYIDLHNATHASFEGLYRVDTRDYPEVAVREALLNALVHRDYAYSSSIIISIFNDRMEFASIGGLMPGVTLDDVLIGLSVCRNEKLANIFYRLELIEAYGTGLNKIIQAYADCSQKPQIVVSNNAFKIILPNRNSKKPVKQYPAAVHENTKPYQISRNRAASPHELKPEAQTILLLAENQYAVSRKDVQEALGISQTTAGRLLKQMVDNGLLTQQGNGKNTKYYPTE